MLEYANKMPSFPRVFLIWMSACFTLAPLSLSAQVEERIVDSLLADISLATSDSTLKVRIESAKSFIGRPIMSEPNINRRIRKHVMGLTTDKDIIGSLFISQIQAHTALGEVDSSIANIHRLHDFSIKVSKGNHEEGIWDFADLIPLYMKKGWYEKTIVFADSMITVPGLIPYFKFQMHYYKVTAYTNLGDYPAALTAARESLADIPEGEAKDYFRINVINQLIDINQQTGDLLASRRWLKEGLAVPENQGTQMDHYYLDASQAELLLDEGRIKESQTLLKGSYFLKDAFDTSYDDEDVFINIHVRHVGIPSLVTYIRTFMKEGDLKDPELRKSIRRVAFLIESNTKYMISSPRLTMLAVLSEYNSLVGNHEKALEYAQLQLEEANVLGNYRTSSQDALKTLHSVQAKAGLTAEAYETLNEYQELTDSVQSRIQNFQAARAAAEIELDEHARARIAAERATVAEREAANLRSRYFWLALLGVGLILAILAWAYRRSRRDQRLIAEQNQLVTQSLSEKEVLLREIHHRVKNNLQIISSLLQKQARFSSDGDAQRLAKEGQERIQSMALIHENLYQSEQLSGVNIRSYLEDLGANISRSHSKPDSGIELALAVEDEYLDLDTAIPVGLILNELLTNAYKYAFPEGKAGQIKVVFQRIGDHFELEVNDNGIGLPLDHAERSSKSLGHNLVKGLVRQLEGTIKWLKPEQGTTVQIEF